MSDDIISDKLRRQASNPFVPYAARKPLETIADRIDDEMVELPKDRDGKPIRIEDVVYGADGKEWRVCEIVLLATSGSKGKYSIKAFGEDGVMLGLRPEWLTHERPDSLACIADEIDRAQGWAYITNNCPAQVPSVSNETLHKWAERIRRLAKEDGR